MPHVVTEEKVLRTLNKTRNWKAPGSDGIHNFWYKKLPAAHIKIAEYFTKAITRLETTPKQHPKNQARNQNRNLPINIISFQPT